MLMNRTFLLACATVVTLGITAASSTPAHARRCSDADSDHQEAACYIRSAIYQAKAAAAQAQQMQAARAQQQMMRQQQMQAARAQQQAQQAAAVRAQQQAAAPRVTKPTATLTSSPCLTKEYVDGAVMFRDTCTGEWAQQNNNIQPKKPGL
jgi:DNA segregation ATPase FtsK/SpoIIIE-like protein